MINPTIKVTLVNLISQGKTKQAIELLLEVTNETALYSKVVLQSARYKDYKDEKNNGLSSYENEKINLTKINNSLLSIIQQIDEYVQQVDEDKVAHILLRGQNTQTRSKKNRPNIIKNNIKPNLSTSKKVGFIGLLIVLVICIQCVFYLNRPISTDEINHLKIGEKLNLGFRFLELRLKKTSKNALKVVGKTNQDIFFEDVQKELIHFLDKHPNETIFIAIQKEDSAAISTLLDQKIKQNLTYWYTSDYLPLKLNKNVRKKIIILQNDDEALVKEEGSLIIYSSDRDKLYARTINDKGILYPDLWTFREKIDRSSNLIGIDVYGKKFILGQNKDSTFFTHKITPDGKIGPINYDYKGDHNYYYNSYYGNLCSFKIGGQTYIAGQNKENHFFIHKVEPDGKIGPITYDDDREKYYENLFSFKAENQVFIAGQSRDKQFFIQKIELGGQLGIKTFSKTWRNYYGVLFSCNVGGNDYIAGQSDSSRFFIQSAESNGKLGEETYSSIWEHYCENLFSFQVSGNTYIAWQDTTNRVFIQKVEPDGQLGDLTYTTKFIRHYDFFTFFIKK